MLFDWGLAICSARPDWPAALWLHDWLEHSAWVMIMCHHEVIFSFVMCVSWQAGSFEPNCAGSVADLIALLQAVQTKTFIMLSYRVAHTSRSRHDVEF